MLKHGVGLAAGAPQHYLYHCYHLICWNKWNTRCKNEI